MTEDELNEAIDKAMRNAYDLGRAAEQVKCIDFFAHILSSLVDICGSSCPVECNWGTEESCIDMCKK